MTNIFRKSYTLISLICFTIIIINPINLLSANTMICPKFRLIQQLNPEEITASKELAFAVIAADKYFIISNLEANSDADFINPSGDMPEMLDNPNQLSKYFYGAMLRDNRLCDPSQYYLLAYKYEELESGHINDWHTKLGLHHWTKDTKWSKPERVLPDYLTNDPYMNTYNPKIMFYWHQRRTLYVIQLSVKNASIKDFRKLYHAIVFPINCSSNFLYLEDGLKNIKEVLQPYEDYDTCFILNDNKLYCMGHTGLYSYDIDLDDTKDGQLRVKGKRTASQIPIISKICKWWQIYGNIEEYKPNTTTTVATTTEQTANNGESKAAFWLIMITIVLLLLGMLLLIVFYCKREKQTNSTDEQQLETSASGISLRSRAQGFDTTEQNNSELDDTTSGISTISTRSAVDNKKQSKLAKKANKLDAKSTLTDVVSTRSTKSTNKQTKPSDYSDIGDESSSSKVSVRTTHK